MDEQDLEKLIVGECLSKERKLASLEQDSFYLKENFNMLMNRACEVAKEYNAALQKAATIRQEMGLCHDQIPDIDLGQLLEVNCFGLGKSRQTENIGSLLTSISEDRTEESADSDSTEEFHECHTCLSHMCTPKNEMCCTHLDKIAELEMERDQYKERLHSLEEQLHHQSEISNGFHPYNRRKQASRMKTPFDRDRSVTEDSNYQLLELPNLGQWRHHSASKLSVDEGIGSCDSIATSPVNSTQDLVSQKNNRQDYKQFNTAHIISMKPVVVREALKLSSRISFVKPVQVLHVTHTGTKYCDDTLGLCINIPEGAVPTAQVLHLEVGMCLYGPFKFPAHSCPIAPILMLCSQEDIVLQKPILVTLPHIIDLATTDCSAKALGIQVIKANHRDVESSHFSFEDIDTEVSFEILKQDEDVKEYATFSIDHFCFLSLRIDEQIKSAATRSKIFCICPFYPVAPTFGSFTYHLPIAYYMDPWIEALKELFREYGCELKKNAITRFTVKNVSTASIQGEIQNTFEKDWKADFEKGETNGTQCISITDVDVWNINLEILKSDIKLLLYPPCFCVLAVPTTSSSPTSFAHLCFKTTEGCTMNIKLVLNRNFSQTPSISLSHQHTSESVSQNTITLMEELMKNACVTDVDLNQRCSEMVLKEVAKNVVHWQTYAEELSLSRQEIEEIRTNNSLTLRLRVSSVLQKWKTSQAFKATYRRLVEVCLSLKDCETAEIVCKLVHSNKAVTV